METLDTTKNKPAIILDCDPGHDDALAILCAARHCELLGITTVSGNIDLEQTTRNALITTQLLGLDTPVHRGADRPLVVPARHAEFIHGASGLDGPQLPPLERSPASHEAVRFLIDTVRSRDDVWLVATGPLTNVALAIRTAPDIVGRLKGISIMGGGTSFGNVTPAAEFNIYCDPEAAEIVFESGARLLMADLDLTHQFMIDEDAIDRIRALASPVATFAADLLTFYGQAYAQAYSGRVEGPLHDPCAVLILSHPHLFEIAPHHVAIETGGNVTRGMTVVDTRGGHRGEAPNTDVLTKIDSDAAFELLLETIASYG
ncbi:MAG: nucleoside hydrolase [Trueperaceae bacterium]|nr:MAG: nucleoside hydrolase [Trueperaceae bacterium]